MIYIYNDFLHNNSHVHMALCDIGYRNAQFCSASMISNGCLENAQLLVMPGGADVYYCEKLNGEGNQRIRDFVAGGGSYLGICAGAYYGCTSLDWNKGEIDGSRELAFYGGQAVGPVFDWVEKPGDIYNGSWIKAVEVATESGEPFLSEYNGGPAFAETDNDVLARYSTLGGQPPAIVGGSHGRGRYILSSPHIELWGETLRNSVPPLFNISYDKKMFEIDKLMPYENRQKEFFKTIIERLL